jgi:hypothetical protein
MAKPKNQPSPQLKASAPVTLPTPSECKPESFSAILIFRLDTQLVGPRSGERFPKLQGEIALFDTTVRARVEDTWVRIPLCNLIEIVEVP